MTNHISDVIANLSRVLYTLRILRSPGMTPAWWDLQTLLNGVEAFICRAIKDGYCAHSTATVVCVESLSVIKLTSNYLLL